MTGDFMFTFRQAHEAEQFRLRSVAGCGRLARRVIAIAVALALWITLLALLLAGRACRVHSSRRRRCNVHLAAAVTRKKPTNLDMIQHEQLNEAAWNRWVKKQNEEIWREQREEIQDEVQKILGKDLYEVEEHSTRSVSEEAKDPGLNKWRQIKLKEMLCEERARRKAERYGYGVVKEYDEETLTASIQNSPLQPVGLLLLVSVNKRQSPHYAIANKIYKFMAEAARKCALQGRNFIFARFNCTRENAPFLARKFGTEFHELPLLALFHHGRLVPCEETVGGKQQVPREDETVGAKHVKAWRIQGLKTVPRKQIENWIAPVIKEAFTLQREKDVAWFLRRAEKRRDFARLLQREDIPSDKKEEIFEAEEERIRDAKHRYKLYLPGEARDINPSLFEEKKAEWERDTQEDHPSIFKDINEAREAQPQEDPEEMKKREDAIKEFDRMMAYMHDDFYSESASGPEQWGRSDINAKHGIPKQQQVSENKGSEKPRSSRCKKKKSAQPSESVQRVGQPSLWDELGKLSLENDEQLKRIESYNPEEDSDPAIANRAIESRIEYETRLADSQRAGLNERGEPIEEKPTKFRGFQHTPVGRRGCLRFDYDISSHDEMYEAEKRDFAFLDYLKSSGAVRSKNISSNDELQRALAMW